MTIERNAVLRCPVSAVYNLLTDESRLTEWREDLISAERLSPPGPLDGARYRETIRTPLGSQTATVQLSTEPLRRVAFEVLDGPLRPRGSLEMREADGSTELTYRVQLEPLLGAPTPLDLAARAYLTRSVERVMARLKELLET